MQIALNTVTTSQDHTPARAATAPGRSSEAPGQQAKAAVAAAQTAGIDLPKNAQGMAASQIARGADPASVFTAKIAEETTVPEDEAPIAGTGSIAETATVDERAPSPVDTAGSAEIALDLLSTPDA